MFVKVLTVLLALAAIVWMVMPSRRPVIIRGRDAPPPRVPHADDLVKCDHCGIWLPGGQPCNCRERV